MPFDAYLEIVHILITGALVGYIGWIGRKAHLNAHKGWWYIFFGFVCLLFGDIIDITNNFDSLNRFRIIGDTPYQAIMGKGVGSLCGLILLAAGLWRWLPIIVERRLIEREPRREIVERASDAIVVLQNGKAVYWNQAFRQLLGYSTEEIETHNFLTSVAPEDRQRTQEYCSKRLGGETVPDEYELDFLTRDGQRVTVEVKPSIIVYQGQPATLIIMRNITERKHATAETRRAKEMAEAANRAKSEFLANISHELRTPLHAILSFAGFGLKRTTFAGAEKMHVYFQQIDRNARTLLELLNDLLDLAALETGKVTFAFEPVDLRPVLREIRAAFNALASEQHLTIRCIYPDHVAPVLLDGAKIRQVLQNLVSNAAKFSRRGGTITLSLRQNEQSAVVTVSDEGIGIPPNELESIFDKFMESSTTRTGAGGTGLGLAICREIVTAHGGRIWAENRPEGGAVFAFELSLTRPDTTAASPDGLESAPPVTVV